MYTVIKCLKDIGLHTKNLLTILGIMVNIVNGVPLESFQKKNLHFDSE